MACNIWGSLTMVWCDKMHQVQAHKNVNIMKNFSYTTADEWPSGLRRVSNLLDLKVVGSNPTRSPHLHSGFFLVLLTGRWLPVRFGLSWELVKATKAPSCQTMAGKDFQATLGSSTSLPKQWLEDKTENIPIRVENRYYEVTRRKSFYMHWHRFSRESLGSPEKFLILQRTSSPENQVLQRTFWFSKEKILWRSMRNEEMGLVNRK